MGSQMIQIIILAGVALFLVLRLRNVLGTRDGFENNTDPAASKRGNARNFEVIEGGGLDHDIADYVDLESDTGKALAEMKRSDPSFSVGEFVQGSKQAYEMILMGFENGELEDLQQFLSPEVFEGFAGSVAEREKKNLSVDASFIGVREVKLSRANFDGETKEAEITMRFVGDVTSVVRDKQGEIVEGDPNKIKRQKEIWTFARKMGADDPNWILVATGT